MTNTMTNAMTISVTCKDEAAKERYTALATKMKDDSEFKAALNQCKTDQEIYDAYKDRGYTDMDFETFKVEFKKMIDDIVSVQKEGSFELSENELENVVGGFSFFRAFTGVVSALPIAGPLISGVAKAVKAGIEGKGIEEIVKQAAVGVGLALVDSVVTISTMGTGAVVAGAVRTGMALGMGAIKTGLQESLTND